MKIKLENIRKGHFISIRSDYDRYLLIEGVVHRVNTGIFSIGVELIINNSIVCFAFIKDDPHYYFYLIGEKSKSGNHPLTNIFQ